MRLYCVKCIDSRGGKYEMKLKLPSRKIMNPIGKKYRCPTCWYEVVVEE